RVARRRAAPPPRAGPATNPTVLQYTLRAEPRNALQSHLKAKGIGCAVYYPVPLHRQECFASLGYAEGRFPVSERAAREVLSLPIYPELTRAQLDAVVGAVREFYR